jgi:hypothetical protein
MSSVPMDLPEATLVALKLSDKTREAVLKLAREI